MCLTFLAFVKDGRTRVVVADLVRVCEVLAAALMDALLGHGGRVGGVLGDEYSMGCRSIEREADSIFKKDMQKEGEEIES